MNYNKWKRSNRLSLNFYDNKAPYKARQFNFIFPLAHYFGEMIEDKKEVYIADLGAGLFSTTGSTWPTAVVHLYPSDIMAAEYLDILNKHNIKPIIHVAYQDMTQLEYPDEFFDIVHCVNALDHCYDPIKALQEMHRVCKPKGWIYLKHYLDNAELQNYHAAHQWNISKNLTIWNKTDNYELVNYFNNITTKLIEEDEPPAKVVIIKIRKEIS